MVLIKSYARTGSRSWDIGGEKVQLKPFRRASMQAEKPPEPARKASLPNPAPKEKHSPQNAKAEYNIQLVPDSPPVIKAGPPPIPKPVRKNANQNKRRTETVTVSFTFVIGGYNTRTED